MRPVQLPREVVGLKVQASGNRLGARVRRGRQRAATRGRVLLAEPQTILPTLASLPRLLYRLFAHAENKKINKRLARGWAGGGASRLVKRLVSLEKRLV